MTRTMLLHAMTIALALTVLILCGFHEAEAQVIDDVNISHFNTNQENNITTLIRNPYNGTALFSVRINIYSYDLQNDIALESNSEVFTIPAEGMHNLTSRFNISYSGSYLVNLSVTHSYEDIIYSDFYEDKITFYNREVVSFTDLITIDYDGVPNNGLWHLVHSENGGSLQTIGINGTDSEFSIVLGPIHIANRIDTLLHLQHISNLTNTGNFIVEYSFDFNKTNRFAAHWDTLFTPVAGFHSNVEILEIPALDGLFIQFRLNFSDDSDLQFWIIESLFITSIRPMHLLNITHTSHHFLDLDDPQPVNIAIFNEGLFTEKWGNLTVHLVCSGPSEIIIDSLGSIRAPVRASTIYEYLPSINAPGIYYCQVEVIVHDVGIYFYQGNFSLSYSKYIFDELPADEITIYPYEKFEVRNIDFIQAELLIKTDDIAPLSFSGNGMELELAPDTYLYRYSFSNNSLVITNHGSGPVAFTLVSLISMDENRFKLLSVSSLEFIEPRNHTLILNIQNLGFYASDFSIQYTFNHSFVSVHAPSSVNVIADESTTVEVVLVPLPLVPERLVDYLQVKVTRIGINVTQDLVIILTYRIPTIIIEELSFNRHALLAGQMIVVNVELVNTGYATTNLMVVLEIVDAEGNIYHHMNYSNISLAYGEEISLSRNYTMQNESLYHFSIQVFGDDNTLMVATSSGGFHVINNRPPNEVEQKDSLVPPSVVGAVITISMLGGVFYFSQSENVKYHVFKLLIPLYSRLQPDSLADDTTRQNLLEYIYGNPGANFTQLKQRFALHNGTLAHHMSVLENNRIIESRKLGRQRLYFPAEKVKYGDLKERMVTNPIQRQIVDFIKVNPGCTQSIIAQHLNYSRQKINYHINILCRNGLIRVEKAGRISRVYPLHFT